MKDLDKAGASQGELAYAQLHAAIAKGEYAPGARLREEEVASKLALSRTPVREALRKLEADGIVEHKARFGAVIRSLGHAEIVELYEMRMVLERTAAEMAAKHASPAEISEMHDLNAALGATQDASDAAQINQVFHRCIYLAARNRFLLEAARSLNNALLILGPTTLDGPERLALVQSQHQDIVNAIEAADEEAAGAAAEAHLQTSLRHRLKALRQ